MKINNKHRLKNLERNQRKGKRYKTALVIYNAQFGFDSTGIEADAILALPDNGRRDSGGGVVIGKNIVRYS